MSRVDKRNQPRLPVNLAATYRSSQRILDVYVGNLSQTGLSLRSSAVDPVGTSAEVTVVLPREPKPALITGEVIWSTADPDRGCSMGIRFDKLPNEARRAIANYLLHSSYLRNEDDA